MRCDAWAGTLSWWSCQSPAAHRCGLLNHLNSFCGGMFKLNAKFDADLLFYLSVISNVTATQYTCSLNCVYPHSPLTGTVKTSLFTYAHSSPLSLAARVIDVAQTILVILTMVGFFWTQTCIHTHICIPLYSAECSLAFLGLPIDEWLLLSNIVFPKIFILLLFLTGFPLHIDYWVDGSRFKIFCFIVF